MAPRLASQAEASEPCPFGVKSRRSRVELFGISNPWLRMHNMSGTPHPGVRVRQHPADATRFFFDFDAATPGGRGGASVRLDSARGLASIDGIHKNVNLPSRSTGAPVA